MAYVPDWRLKFWDITCVWHLTAFFMNHVIFARLSILFSEILIFQIIKGIFWAFLQKREAFIVIAQHVKL